jgi:hypothetical protein
MGRTQAEEQGEGGHRDKQGDSRDVTVPPTILAKCLFCLALAMVGKAVFTLRAEQQGRDRQRSRAEAGGPAGKRACALSSGVGPMTHGLWHRRPCLEPKTPSYSSDEEAGPWHPFIFSGHRLKAMPSKGRQ